MLVPGYGDTEIFEHRDTDVSVRVLINTEQFSETLDFRRLKQFYTGYADIPACPRNGDFHQRRSG